MIFLETADAMATMAPFVARRNRTSLGSKLRSAATTRSMPSIRFVNLVFIALSIAVILQIISFTPAADYIIPYDSIQYILKEAQSNVDIGMKAPVVTPSMAPKTPDGSPSKSLEDTKASTGAPTPSPAPKGPKDSSSGDFSSKPPVETKKTPDETTCYRQCANYDNLVIFHGPNFSGTGAGLNDRVWIMAGAANFAAYLCARLVVPSPTTMLGPQHNFGKRVSKKLTWKNDFLDIVLKADGSSAIIQADNTTDIEQSFLQKNATILDSMRKDRIVEVLHKLRDRVSRNSTTPFVWKIDRSYWDGFNEIILPELQKLSNTTEGRMLPIPTDQPEGACPAVKRVNPPFVSSTIDKVTDAIGTKQYGSLHLRRGDSIKACNTSIPAVRDYIACSMNGTIAPDNFTMVLGTEETNREYLEGIKEMVESFGFRFKHLDHIVNEVMKQQVKDGNILEEKLNNHLTYLIVSKVSYRGKFYLERRREMACWDCAHWLVEKLEEAGVKLRRADGK